MDPATTFASSLALLALLALAAVALLWRRDLKALRAARQTLAEDRDRLQFILRSSGIAIWSWDATHDSITWDETCSVLFGFAPGEAPRTIAQFAAVLHSEDVEPVQKTVQHTLETGSDYKADFRVVWPDHTVRYLTTRGKLQKDEAGGALRLTGVTWDATESRVVAGQLRAANERLQHSHAELDQRARESILLAEMSDMLQSCVSAAETHQVIIRSCERLFPAWAGALFLFRASRNQLDLIGAWKDPALPLAEFSPEDCWALRRGNDHHTLASATAIPCRHLEGAGRAAYSCIPLTAQGSTLGVLCLQSLPGAAPAAPSPAEHQLYSAVARQLALALANINLRDALRSQTIRDPLTGLFNRRYMEDSLERELHRMARRSNPAGFVMMDIDHFKAFNDAHGHDGGDAVLRAFGAFLKERMRKEDIACRYGGEEFCLVLAESSLTDTARRCEQLRAEVRHMAVKHGSSHLPAIALSFGVAGFPVHGNTVPDLIAAADDALYQAKAAGRDRVVLAPVPEPASAL